VVVQLLYLTFRQIMAWLALLARSANQRTRRSSVLRHEIAGLRRQVSTMDGHRVSFKVQHNLKVDHAVVAFVITTRPAIITLCGCRTRNE
jgi:hypothetical protein